MADQILADVGQMTTAISNLRNAETTIEDVLHTISQQLESLAPSFRGKTAADYQALMADWSSTAMKLQQTFTEINTRLNKALQDLQQLDNDMSQGFH